MFTTEADWNGDETLDRAFLNMWGRDYIPGDDPDHEPLLDITYEIVVYD